MQLKQPTAGHSLIHLQSLPFSERAVRLGGRERNFDFVFFPILASENFVRK
jgi:hypothetical protein